MAGTIVVIGSSNTDFIMKMERLPRKKETVTGATFLQTFGGKGANQAVGAARAGGAVEFVNCVGDDPFGGLIIENLRAAEVGVEGVFRETGVASGSALIMIDAAGENFISVAPGANWRLGKTHLERARSLVAQAAMVMLQYEIQPETLRDAVDLCAGMGKPVMLNLAPARPIRDETLRKIDIFVVNEVEAEFVCGFAVDGEEAARRAARALREKGPRVVVITLGGAGSLVAEGSELFTVPAFPVEVVDTTAAGDIFCGALAAGLVEGKPLRESVRFASAAAAISVTRLGAQPSAPSRAEIDAFLRERA